MNTEKEIYSIVEFNTTKLMETRAGIEITPKQEKDIKALQRVLKNFDRDLQINCIAGVFYVFLKGDTEQNPHPEMLEWGGFNPDNVIWMTNSVFCDGGDW